MKKAVIFDRDGTLIIDKVYLNDPSKIEYLPGCFEALKQLRDRGFVFAVATNQSGLAKGIVQIRNMDLIHEKMSHDFARHGVFFLGFYYAPFSTDSLHPRRKPGPGMIDDAARDHGLDLRQSWMIGDRMTDIEAGARAGVRSILLEGVETPDRYPHFARPFCVAKNLLEVAQVISAFEISNSIVQK